MNNRLTAPPSEKAQATPVRSNRFSASDRISRIPPASDRGSDSDPWSARRDFCGFHEFFSIGFFLGGAGVGWHSRQYRTLPYGPEGKHGANYMQTMAASVATMCGLGVLIQAMVWLGLPQPPAWQLVLYFLCVGMFGVGIGMFYTPVLVDRMQLPFPSRLRWPTSCGRSRTRICSSAPSPRWGEG